MQTMQVTWPHICSYGRRVYHRHDDQLHEMNVHRYYFAISVIAKPNTPSSYTSYKKKKNNKPFTQQGG